MYVSQKYCYLFLYLQVGLHVSVMSSQADSLASEPRALLLLLCNISISGKGLLSIGHFLFEFLQLKLYINLVRIGVKFGLSCDRSGVKFGLSCDRSGIKFGLSCDRSG